MANIEMWTDGSCKVNPGGPGGWAVILESDGRRKELSGRLSETTNNRAELLAVINGLRALKGGPHDVTLHTDSQYVIYAVRGMKKPKINHDLLAELAGLVAQHRVTPTLVPGHAGIANNERCDLLAAAVYA